MQLKDFFPLIGTVLTLFVGYKLLSVQVNKNRKAKWLDDFRKEFSNFFVIATSINKEYTSEEKFGVYVNKSYEMLASITMLTLYLIDTKEERSLRLINELREIHGMTLKQRNPHDLKFVETFGEKLASILTLTTSVMMIEQKKI